MVKREFALAMRDIDRAVDAAIRNRPAEADRLWRRAEGIHLYAAWSALEKWQGRKG
jgi:hypothetical protein